ncbi:FAD:protein FMN transferase [Halothermothrix orenii]|uniref:FAD:protein FMN transferase n=1 Tax=Halothermothrix orenii TaxID=31909 RepID=UPI0002EBCACD|nr:FAD:protein FMN transferase [Halothermothrix orenii]
MLNGCQGQKEKNDLPAASKSSFLMDTIVSMKVYGEKPDKVIEEAFQRMREIENEMSVTLKSSYIYKINSNPGEPVKVDSDTFRVIRKAITYAEITDGNFDPSIRPLVSLWGIGTENARVPARSEIEEAKRLVNYKLIKLDEEEKTVVLQKPGMGIDLGAIAKGYAADEVRRIFKKHRVEHAFVNLGGNVLVVGGKPDGSPWVVGIQDPRRERGSVMASFKVKDKAIVTSGNYERYFEKDGVVYHHIIDPKTGSPARTNLLSATIICDDSFDADALSTSVFVMGVDRGLELVESLNGVEVMFINKDLEIILSEGLKNKIKVLNQDFKLVGNDNDEQI